jgi:protein O-mannosyl-transferase
MAKLKRHSNFASETLANGYPFFSLFIIAAVSVVYSNSFSVPFLLDDRFHIVENPIIRSFASLSSFFGDGRPVVLLSLALNFAVSGLNVWSYHAFNIVIHILTALTLFGLVRRTLRASRFAESVHKSAMFISFSVALLWALHPIQTQAVNYVIQRSESLMSLFYLLTIYTFVRGVQSDRFWKWGLFSLMCCVLGMATKQVMVTAPIFVLVYDRIFVTDSWRGIFRKRLVFYGGLFLSWITLILLHAQVDPSKVAASAGFGLDSISPFEYALSQAGVILHYLKLSFWPTSLCFDYVWPVTTELIEALPSLLVLVGILIFSVALLFRRSALGFLGFSFFLMLAPTSSIMPIADLAVEHRLYLPLAPLICLCVIALKKCLAPQSVSGVVFTVTLFMLALILGALTFQRNQVYASEMLLWQDTVLKRPLNPRAHSNLGQAFQGEGRNGEAITHYKEALRLAPDFAKAHNNLGQALDLQGNLDEAIAHYEKALKINPDFAEAHNNLGAALADRGKLDEAIGHYEKAEAVKPFYSGTYSNWGNALFRKGKVAEAIEKYQKALSIQPNSAEVHNNLGVVFASQKKLDQAISYFKEALRLQPNYPDAKVNLKRAEVEIRS